MHQDTQSKMNHISAEIIGGHTLKLNRSISIYNYLERPPATFEEISVPNAAGRFTLQNYQFKSGVKLYFMSFDLKSDLRLCYERIADSRLVFSIALNGQGTYTFENNREFSLCHPEIALFRRIKKGSVVYFGNQKTEILNIAAPVDYLFSAINMSNISTSPKLANLLLQPMQENVGLLQLDVTQSNLAQRIRNLHHQPQEKYLALEATSLLLLDTFIEQLLQNQSLTPEKVTGLSDRDTRAIQRAKQYLHTDFHTDLTIKTIARNAGVCETKLKAGFKSLYDETILSYRTNKRLAAAYLLLTEKGVSVSEAANRVGYKKTSHFTKLFKAKYSVYPSQINRSTHSGR